MTVIVGFVGADGAVMASDSEGTEGQHSRRDLQKCWTCGGLLLGLSGTSSIRQPLEPSIQKKIAEHFVDSTEIDRWLGREVLRQVTGDVLKREYGAFVPFKPEDGPQAIASLLLVIGRDKDGYWLLEIDYNNQPTFYHDLEGFHTIGSGSPAAYLAKGLMKAYSTQNRSIDHLKLVAYRTVDACIQALSGSMGVGGEVQLHASHDGGPFEREDDEGLARLQDAVAQWTTLEAESLDSVVLGETPRQEGDTEGEGDDLPEAIEDDGERPANG